MLEVTTVVDIDVWRVVSVPIVLVDDVSEFRGMSCFGWLMFD